MVPGLTPFPRERDYDNTPEGAKDYARDIGEWAKAYTDATDQHRKTNVSMIDKMVIQHEADLQPSSTARPGWVARDILGLQAELARFIDQVAKDNVALLDDNDNIRKEMKWYKRLALSALISVAVFSVQQLLLKGVS